MYIDVLIVLDKEDYFPSFVPYRLKSKNYPYNRTGEMISVFKNNTELIRTAEYNEKEKDKYTDRIIKFSGDNYSCFTYNPYTCENVTYAIESVDTTRPWTIERTGVGERVRYFDKNEKYFIKDEDLNYGEKL